VEPNVRGERFHQRVHRKDRPSSYVWNEQLRRVQVEQSEQRNSEKRSRNVHRYPVDAGHSPRACFFFVCSDISHALPQLYYGEEQNIYLYDNTANNYLFGCVLTTLHPSIALTIDLGVKL